MEELLLEIVRLEEQESEIAAKLQRMDSIEPEYQRMEEELNAVGRVIASKKSDWKLMQEKQQAIEEKVHEDIAFTISGVDLSVLPAEMITVVEMIVKADRRRIYAEHAIELEQTEDEAAAYKAETDLRISNQDKAIEALRSDYETCARELHEQEAETIRLVAERDDFKRKLANASATIAEKDLEIKRLNSQIDEYQVAKVHGEREKQRIINLNEDETSSINNAIAKVKESWEEKANRALSRWDLPAIEPPVLAEVPQFQNEPVATEPSSDQLHIPEATEVSQFPEAGPEMAIPTPGVEETVSREEFQTLIRDTRIELETIKADVEALKRRNGMVA